MIKRSFGETDIEALRYWRFPHPDPRVQVRLESIYWRRQMAPMATSCDGVASRKQASIVPSTPT
jgi:hypothetical protein